MKFKVFIVTVFFVCSLLPGISFAQNKVVVIPLFGNEATGDATPSDVLNGKTFSNSNATGLTGQRPLAPVRTDYLDTQNTVQPTDPRFYNTNNALDYGYGVKDSMTDLIWQKELNTSQRTYYQALFDCLGLTTGYMHPIFGLVKVGDWRLPTITELQSLIGYDKQSPALPDEVQTGVFNNLAIIDDYWSSTLMTSNCGIFLTCYRIRYINMKYGDTATVLYTSDDPEPVKYTWCVRGPYFN